MRGICQTKPHFPHFWVSVSSQNSPFLRVWSGRSAKRVKIMQQHRAWKGNKSLFDNWRHKIKQFVLYLSPQQLTDRIWGAATESRTIVSSQIFKSKTLTCLTVSIYSTLSVSCSNIFSIVSGDNSNLLVFHHACAVVVNSLVKLECISDWKTQPTICLMSPEVTCDRKKRLVLATWKVTENFYLEKLTKSPSSRNMGLCQYMAKEIWLR